MNQIITSYRFNKCLKAICICLALIFCSFSINAETKVSKHHQIMAGFLLHLTSFTQWPATLQQDFQLCIFGKDPFAEYLDEMLKRRPKNRTGQVITINRLNKNNAEQLSMCQLVYVQPSYYNLLWQHISPAQRVLLVSQNEQFISLGGMINFALHDKKVKLEVNLPAVEAANLKISSELLKHAKIITGTSHQAQSKVGEGDGPQ